MAPPPVIPAELSSGFHFFLPYLLSMQSFFLRVFKIYFACSVVAYQQCGWSELLVLLLFLVVVLVNVVYVWVKLGEIR